MQGFTVIAGTALNDSCKAKSIANNFIVTVKVNMGFIWKWDSPEIDRLSSWIICWDKAISGLRQKNMPYWFHWYLRWWYHPDEFHVKYHYHCGSIPIVFQVSPIMYAKYQLSVGYIPDCIIIFPLWYNDIRVFGISHGDFPEKKRTMVSPCIILLGCILMLIPFNAQMIIRNIISFISFISFTVSLYCPISSVSCAPQFFMVDTISWKRISDDIITTSKRCNRVSSLF